MNLSIVLFALGALASLVAVLVVLSALIQPKLAALVRDAPLTNLSILVALALTAVVVLSWVVACVFLKQSEPAGFNEVIVLLSVTSGVTGSLQVAKRFSFKQSAPPDAEDDPHTKPTAPDEVKEATRPDPMTQILPARRATTPPAAPIVPLATREPSAAPIAPQTGDVGQSGLATGEGD